MSLPDLTISGSITVPGLVLHAHAFSPDGRTLVAEADHRGSDKDDLVAIDVATGRELARRRRPLSPRAAFLPDGQTVVLGKAGDVRRSADRVLDGAGVGVRLFATRRYSDADDLLGRRLPPLGRQGRPPCRRPPGVRR